MTMTADLYQTTGKERNMTDEVLFANYGDMVKDGDGLKTDGSYSSKATNLSTQKLNIECPTK